MTDKQIIIDGVDVSGCKKYEHEIVRCNATLKNMCFCGGRCTDKKNADCYFKQLKRKEQECEELKKYLHKNFEEKDKLHLIIDRLLEASGYDTNTASAEDFEDVYENMRYEKQQLEQLKQTLAEIKEIVEIEIECKTYEIENDCFNETRCKALNEHIDFIKQILQKIRKVENDNK